MNRVTVKLPPDRTPQEEAELVARIAAAYEARDEQVTVEVEESEEVDYRSVAPRTEQSSRWTA